METIRAITATEVIAQLDEYVSAGRDEEAVALWRRIGRDLWPQMSRDERSAVLSVMELASRYATEQSAP